MSIKLDKRYSVSQEITSDVVNKNKLYKNKHGWVNSQKKFLVGSAALLSGTFIMSLNGLSANADEVSYPNTDTSEVTQTKGTTEDGKGYEVNVDRSELQDAANKANQTGVDISQGQETSQTVAEKDKVSAVDNIKNNYSEQVKAVREATDAQQWKNDTYQNNSNDANATNASNKQKIDEAVKNAQDAGAIINHKAEEGKTLTSKPGRYDNSQYEQQKNEVNSNTQAQVDALNKAAEQARANKKGLDAANDHSALDEAVKNAQNTGVTVNKTDDVDRGTIRPDNVDGISEAIKNDYANQVNEINKATELGNKVNETNNQIKKIIDEYNELAEKLGVTKLSPKELKVKVNSDADISNDNVNKEILYLQDQLKILQDQNKEKEKNKDIEDAIQNANKGNYTTIAKNVDLNAYLYEGLTDKKLVDTFSTPSIKDFTNYYTEISFDVDSSLLKRGNTVGVFKVKLDTNNTKWNKYSNFDVWNNAVIFDSSNKKIGYIRANKKGDGNIDYYLIIEQDASDLNSIGTQTLKTSVVNSQSGGLNYDTPADIFKNNNNDLTGKVVVSNMDNNVIKNYNINIPKANFNLTDFTGLGSPAASISMGNYHQNPHGVGSYTVPNPMVAINTNPKGNTDVNKYSVDVNKQNVYQFVQSVDLSVDDQSNVGINGGINNLNNVGDSVRLGVRLWYNIINENNQITNEVVQLNLGTWVDPKLVDKLPIVTRVADNTSIEDMQNQLNQTPDVTRGLITKTGDDKWNLVYNVTKSWMQDLTQSVANTDLFEKKSYYINQLSNDNYQKALNNTRAFYSTNGNTHGLTQIDFWGAATDLTYPNLVTHVKLNSRTLNTTGKYTFNIDENYDTVPETHLAKGQSGIIVHYIDGTTGQDMHATTYSIGNVGTNQTIIPPQKLGYVVTTEGAKYPSGVSIIEKQSDVNYPSQGTWANHYIVYMPAKYENSYSVYETPTVSYHYNTVDPEHDEAEANYHYENLAVEVPDKEKANYNFAKLNVLNDVHKGDTGVVNSQDKVFDGKKIVAGDKFTYDIIPSSLQASTDQTNATREKTESFTFQDKLPDGVKFESLTVSDGHNAQDLTKEFNIAFDPATNTVTAVAKQGMLDAINADLTKTYALPRFHVHVQAEKSGADLANTANIWVDGIKTKSNEVPNKITISEPKKEVTIDGDNADNKNTVQGHVQKFVITMDLSDFDPATTTVTDNSVDKGLGLDDKMSSTNATFLIDQNSFVLRDQNSNEISKDLYTLNVNQVNDSNATFSLNVKDPRGFLNSYGGQKLKLEYLSTIKSNENGSIDNIATQNNFGVKYDSNPVHTNVTKLEPHKDVVISLNDPTSINTHIVKIGQTMAYTLDSAKRPANYAGNTTQWSKSDKLDSKDTYNNQNKVTTLTSFTMNGKTYNAGDDITDLFTFSFDKATNTVTTSAKQEYIDAINQPENKVKEQQWRTWIGVTRNAAGHITNTFDEKYNNNELMSNEVYTNTLNNPKKEWDNEAGENSTDKSFLTGDHVIGNVSAEVPTKEMFTKDYTFDKYELQDIYSSFKDLVDVGASKVFVDKQDITDLFDIKVDADKGVVHAIAKDPTKLLEFGGKNINFLTDFQIHKDVAAGTKLENDARQLVNDVDMKLDKKPSVTTFNQVPVKDVQVDKLNADKSSTAQSIDGKKVVAGTVVTFPLATKDPLPANRGTVINKEVRTDKLQDGLSYQGFTAYVKDAQGNIIDATDWFDAKQDGQTITFTGNQKLFDYYNKDKSVATNRPTILLYAKAEKEKTEYKNDYTIVTNNNDVVSNEVKITTPTIDPVKFVKNSAGQDINDMTISRGDQLNYEIAWDLSDLNDLEYTDEQIATGLSVYDDYDENMVKVDKENAIHIKDAKGNVVPADLYSITWDDENGKWTVKANDPVKFLETYKGQKLTIHFMAKASKNIDGDIKNQAWQNTFGQINGTNIVVNHLKKMEPKKDVTVNVGSQESLNNKEIGLNDIFNYKLTSSIRPANYGGVTENWDFIDKLDTKDQFTGQWQVRTDYDITLKDGTVLKKGTDVSKWFYQEFDAETNTVKVKASKEFLDILNMDINKKTEQGFTAYIQAKRIGYGDVKNIFVENYNGEDVQSNEVITHTPEPEKPVEPAKPTPETPAPVAPTPVSTPQTGSAAPAQPELPQMGDSNESDLMAIIGLAFAGLGLGLGAAYRKKQVN